MSVLSPNLVDVSNAFVVLFIFSAIQMTIVMMLMMILLILITRRVRPPNGGRLHEPPFYC